MADSDIHEVLYWASQEGEDDPVRELLAAGAEPDKYKYDKKLNKALHGNTALAAAASYGHDSIVSILIQHGADINRQNEIGNTALHYATFQGSHIVTAFDGTHKATITLIEAGADLNIRNKKGKTALDYANSTHIARLEY